MLMCWTAEIQQRVKESPSAIVAAVMQCSILSRLLLFWQAESLHMLVIFILQGLTVKFDAHTSMHI